MGKKYAIKNLRLVALVEPDTTFKGYDIVKLDMGVCKSVFDDSLEYPYVERLEDLDKDQTSALKSDHMYYNEAMLRVVNGVVAEESLHSFVSEMGTDSQGRFYFPNYEGEKVKSYGTYWS